jgi:hypothetical protein
MGDKTTPSVATAAATVSAICAVICVVATLHSCRSTTRANVIAALQNRPYLSLDVISQGGEFLRAEKQDGADTTAHRSGGAA